jgi:hypothetical protein
LIALVTMLIDHIGAIIVSYFWPGGVVYALLRIIGRIAFPLFAFMISEGVLHSKKPIRYLMRLAVSALLIGTAIYIIDANSSFSFFNGNIFVDLLVAALAIFALRQKGWFKALAVIPTAAAVALFIFDAPVFLEMEYHLYGFTMAVGFYLIRQLGNWYLRRQTEKFGISYVGMTLTPQYQQQQNVYASIWLLTVNLIWYIIFVIDADFVNLSMGAQTYSIMAAFFLFAYSGRRGYNKAWFQYGSYAFYPLHLIVLYGILQLVILLSI